MNSFAVDRTQRQDNVQRTHGGSGPGGALPAVHQKRCALCAARPLPTDHGRPCEPSAELLVVVCSALSPCEWLVRESGRRGNSKSGFQEIPDHVSIAFSSFRIHFYYSR